MSDALANTARRLLKDARSQHGKVLVSRILNWEDQWSGGTKFTAAESHIKKLGSGWIEIISSAQALRAIPKYLRKEAARPSSVTTVQHLRYHFENYLHENYVLQERLCKFLKMVQRAYRGDNELPAHLGSFNNIGELIHNSLKPIIEMRKQHVHDERFEDVDLWRLSMLESMADQNRIFRPFLRTGLRKVRRKKLEAIRLNNHQIDKLLDIYFRAIYPIVFHKKGNVRFPPGVDAA